MKQMMGKLSPANLAHVTRTHQGCRGYPNFLELIQQGMKNLGWGDFSKVQMR